MTPLALEILLHYHSRANDYRDGDFSAPAVRELIDSYRDDEGLLEAVPEPKGYRCYRLTPRGEAYIRRVLSVPLPRVEWVFD